MKEAKAGYRNVLGIFRVDNAAGDILQSNGVWLLTTDTADPNNSNELFDAVKYRNAALARSQAVFDEGPGKKLVAPDEKIVTIPDDWDYFSYYLHQNGNSTYQGGTSKVGNHWFAFDDVNKGQYKQFRMAAPGSPNAGSIEVEDLSQDPQQNPWLEDRDNDYNDVVFKFTAIPSATQRR